MNHSAVEFHADPAEARILEAERMRILPDDASAERVGKARGDALGRWSNELDLHPDTPYLTGFRKEDRGQKEICGGREQGRRLRHR